jgi:maleylacetoacetate isomerase
MSIQPESTRVLKNYWRSSCSWRVRLVLAHKKLDYKYVPVNLLKGEDGEEDYYRTNPAGVPTLFDSDQPTHAIIQSLAACEYLEERYPEHPVLPRGFHERASVRAVANYIASGIQPLQNLNIGQKIEAKFGEAAKKQWLVDVIEEGMQGLEFMLAKTAGSHCVGDAFTLADCCLIPQAYAARRFSVDLAKFPIISRVLATIENLDVAKATHPDQMPDAVKA